MSTLVITLAPHPRLGPAPGESASSSVAWALTDDGLVVTREGRSPVAELPRADRIVAVLHPMDVSWHSVRVPKASPARMPAALAGLLEDALLDDLAATHLSLAPGARAGEPGWVAATDRAALTAALAQLERAGRPVERVVPSLWPDAPPLVFVHDAAADGGAARLTVSHAHPGGVAHWPLSASSRSVLPQELPSDWLLTATPAAAAPADRWLGRPVQVVTAAEFALRAARSLWNLRQFDLAARHRGVAALREGLTTFWRHPAWRPLRVGLAALLVVQLVGLNAEAWRQRNAVAQRKAEMVALLQSAHPQVRAVLDAPAQMQRETDALRAAAGRAGEADLEALLQAAASAWPAQQPVQTLNYEPGRLTLATPGWDDAQLARLRDALAPGGWRVEPGEGRVTLSRAITGSGTPRT